MHFKSSTFSTNNGGASKLFSVYGISNHENLILNVSITLLQISLKLHEHRGGYWRKKLP